MIFRDAEFNDCEWILNCRNDDETRSQSFSSHQITLEEHENWFSKSLSMDSRKILIVEIHDERVCMVRLDEISATEAEISINIAPQYRGRGLGSVIVRESSRQALLWKSGLLVITAFVKQSNKASLKCFANAGYEQINRNHDTIKLELGLHLT
ncbi:MAG: N-acetyltransferase family protein [Candidatus Pristimantibacillus sp.]